MSLEDKKSNVVPFKKREDLFAEECVNWIDSLLSGDEYRIKKQQEKMKSLDIDAPMPIPLREVGVDFDVSAYSNKDLAECLQEYQNWRKGGEGSQPDSKYLGAIIDEVIKRINR